MADCICCGNSANPASGWRKPCLWLFFWVLTTPTTFAHSPTEMIMSVYYEIAPDAVICRVETATELFDPLISCFRGTERVEGITDEQMAKTVEAFVKKHNPITIDGIVVNPVVELKDFQPAGAPPEGTDPVLGLPGPDVVPMGFVNAIIRIVYGTKVAPEKVSLVWTKPIPPREWDVTARLEAFGDVKFIRFIIG